MRTFRFGDVEMPCDVAMEYEGDRKTSGMGTLVEQEQIVRGGRRWIVVEIDVW